MIEGLKFKLTGAELKKHCYDRRDYHMQRANDKDKELPALEDAIERIKATGSTNPELLASMSKTYHMTHEDPVGALQKDIKEHKNKALLFNFYAEHFFDDIYSVEPSDLVALEIARLQVF